MFATLRLWEGWGFHTKQRPKAALWGLFHPYIKTPLITILSILTFAIVGFDLPPQPTTAGVSDSPTISFVAVPTIAQGHLRATVSIAGPPNQYVQTVIVLEALEFR